MRGETSGNTGIRPPTRNSRYDGKVPSGLRRDLSPKSGNGSERMRRFGGYSDGDRDRDGHSRRFSFNQGLPSIDSPSVKFQWENLLRKPGNLGGNGKPAMDCGGGYGAENSRMDTEKCRPPSDFMGTVPKSMSMVDKRARAFLPCTSGFGPTNNSPHMDGRQGNFYFKSLYESCERFSSPHMGSDKESIPMRDYAWETRSLGGEIDEDVLIPGSLPIGVLSTGKLHEDRRSQGHSLSDKLFDKESYLDAQIQDLRIVDRTLGRGLCMEEEKARFHPSHKDTCHCLNEEEKPNFFSMDTSHHMMPLAQTKAFSTISKNGPHGPHKNRRPSDGFRHETDTSPLGWDGDDWILGLGSPRKPELGSKKQVQFIPTECKSWNYHCPELSRIEKGNLGTVSDEYKGKMETFGQDLDYQDSVRGSIIGSLVDRIDDSKSSFGNHTRDIKQWEYLDSSQEPSIRKYLDASKTKYGIRLDGEVLGSRGTHLEFETEVYENCESIRQVRCCDFERNVDHWPYEERSQALEHDAALDVRPQQSLALEELGMPDLSEYSLKRKCHVDKDMSKHNPRSKLSSHQKTSRKTYNLSSRNERRSSEDIGDIFLSNKSVWSNSSRNLSGIQNRISHPCKPGGKDVRKRLEAGLKTGHVSCHVARKHKPQNFLKRRFDDSYGSLHIEGVPLKCKVSAASIELEGSEEFKQQVQGRFLKFVKLLNENRAQQRIYTEQGKNGKMKCGACGRNSKEFKNTIELVMHTVMSPEAGLRAQHLGLFKALCLLMGWNSEVPPNKPWVQQALPAAESLALKEDLIIWPPVVIVHNSSIGNNNPDERMIVTIDMLESILRDMGFDEGKTKICRGKPANQSIMVVKFLGTFSGLQMAEKLHHIYAENQHGRAELEQIKSNNGKTSSCRDNQNARRDKVEHVIYGYLGVAGDLDKLDFEAKERCVVKSKKEILAIAEASLVNE